MGGKHCHVPTCKYHPKESEGFPEDGTWELRAFFDTGDGKVCIYFCSTEHLIEWSQAYLEKEKKERALTTVYPAGHVILDHTDHTPKP